MRTSGTLVDDGAVLHRWCDHDDVRLHALDTGADGARPAAPVLVVPGWPEHADEYAWLGAALTDRRVVIADLRGRGQSDAPRRGYAWEDHVHDLVAITDAVALPPAVVVAFSRGSSYALGYALARAKHVRGVVIGDYLAQHVRLPPEFLDVHSEMVVRGTPATERVAPHVVEQLQADSEAISLWERLRELEFPVLLVRGGRAGALVDDEVEARYRAALPAIRVARLESAGHDLWSRDPDAYLAVLRPFLQECDRG
jgi:pimeloyl-ACP methyl ester carboxylesterase